MCIKVHLKCVRVCFVFVLSVYFSFVCFICLFKNISTILLFNKNSCFPATKFKQYFSLFLLYFELIKCHCLCNVFVWYFNKVFYFYAGFTLLNGIFVYQCIMFFFGTIWILIFPVNFKHLNIKPHLGDLRLSDINFVNPW